MICLKCIVRAHIKNIKNKFFYIKNMFAILMHVKYTIFLIFKYLDCF